jgi:uncharacterized protein (DUF924 family)
MTANDILDFWFSHRVQPLHFQKDLSFDKEIIDRFLVVYQEAYDSQLRKWQQTAEGSLALIVLLDQFSRNMFCNTPLSFDSDKQARSISKLSIENGL